MRALAARGHARAAELYEKANALDAATQASFAPNADREATKRLLGAWARARRLWCDLTGEALI